ncbi:MAG: hypothetical protein Q7S84_00355 [bacterium]|nr:hypothetical protein [bacterium]
MDTYHLRLVVLVLLLVLVGGLVSSASRAAAATDISIGSRVMTTANLGVRKIPILTSPLFGRKPTGSQGTVIAGPTLANGYTWWQIDYDAAPDGWSVGKYLVQEQSATSAIGKLSTVPAPIVSQCTTSFNRQLAPQTPGWTSRVATDGRGNVYMVWRGEGDGLQFAVSENRGKSFNSPVNILGGYAVNNLLFYVAAGEQPASTDSPRRIYVIGQINGSPNTARMLWSDNNGKSWSDPGEVPLKDYWGGFSFAAHPTKRGRIAVAYVTRTSRGPDLTILESDDGGGSWWSQPIVGTNAKVSYPELSLESDALHLAFLDKVGNAPRVFYMKAVWNGAFGSARQISSAASFAGQPKLSTDGTKGVFIVWKDQRFGVGLWGGELFLSRSLDGGNIFLPEQRVTYTTQHTSQCGLWGSTHGCIEEPVALAAAPGVLVVSWRDFRGVVTQDTTSVRGMYSVDRGASFRGETIFSSGRVPDGAGGSVMAADGTYIYHTWQGQSSFSQNSPRSVEFNVVQCPRGASASYEQPPLTAALIDSLKQQLDEAAMTLRVMLLQIQ